MELTDVIKLCPKSNALPSPNTHVTTKAVQSFYNILLIFAFTHISAIFRFHYVDIFLCYVSQSYVSLSLSLSAQYIFHDFRCLSQLLTLSKASVRL